jgi:invasion protein IalB
MSLQTFSRAIALGLGLTLAGTAAFAQETAAPATTEAAPGADLNMGTTPGAPKLKEAKDAQPGELYLGGTFEQWELRCVKAKDGSDPCELYQLLKDQKGNAVSEISMFPLPAGGKAAAGATVMVPLETLLTANMTLTIDTAQPKVYPFTVCGQVGCVARVGFTADEVAQFKKGAKATLTIVPFAAPDQKVNLDISLKGFTAGFEGIKVPEKPAGN